MRIRSKTSSWDLGLNVDQLITYTVSCNLSGPLVEVLEVFDLTNRCQQIVCGEGGKSVAFVRQVLKDFGRDQCATRERPCFGIWMRQNLTPPIVPPPDA